MAALHIALIVSLAWMVSPDSGGAVHGDVPTDYLREQTLLHLAAAAGLEPAIQLAWDADHDERFINTLRQFIGWRMTALSLVSHITRLAPPEVTIAELCLDKGELRMSGLGQTDDALEQFDTAVNQSVKLCEVTITPCEPERASNACASAFSLSARTRSPFPILSDLPKTRTNFRSRLQWLRPELVDPQELPERLDELQELIRLGVEVESNFAAHSARAQSLTEKAEEELQFFQQRGNGPMILGQLRQLAGQRGVTLSNPMVMRERQWQRLWLLPLEIDLAGSLTNLAQLLEDTVQCRPVLCVWGLRARAGATPQDAPYTLRVSLLAAWADGATPAVAVQLGTRSTGS